MHGVVYCITNLLNGKVYVGQTCQGEKRRFKTHLDNAKYGRRGALYNAIRKYGPEAFTIIVLREAPDQQTLDDMEAFWIRAYRSMEKQYGYNLREGGSGKQVSEETRRRMSEAAKRRGPNRPRKNPPKPKLTKEQISALRSLAAKAAWSNPEAVARRQKKMSALILDPAFLEKRGAAIGAARRTEESRRKTSEASKRAFQNEATREKHSASGKRAWAELTEEQKERRLIGFRSMSSERGRELALRRWGGA